MDEKQEKLTEIIGILNRLHESARFLWLEENVLAVNMNTYYCTVGTNPKEQNNTLQYVNVHVDSWQSLKRIAKMLGTQLFCRKQGVAYSYEYSTVVGMVRFFVLENTYYRRKDVIRLHDIKPDGKGR